MGGQRIKMSYDWLLTMCSIQTVVFTPQTFTAVAYFFRLPIEISFTATEQKEVNFNVLCHVKKKTSPLTLNVKAEGYAMNTQLVCEDSQGNKVELTSKGTNRINLGMVSFVKKNITGKIYFKTKR